MVTLSQIEQLSKECEAAATPHRVPNFERIKDSIAPDSDPEVHGYLSFIEECNTRCEGALFRWILAVKAMNGSLIKFQVDLFPGAIKRVDAEWRP